MDGIANVAKHQQSQVSSADTHGRVHEQSQQVQNTHETRTKKNDVVKQMQTEAKDNNTKVDSQEKVEDLVKQLNDALAPMSTDLKFGVDSQDIFYVSVIEAKTHKMIRRFPAEQAQDFLPKMQEVSGLLFDTKG